MNFKVLLLTTAAASVLMFGSAQASDLYTMALTKGSCKAGGAHCDIRGIQIFYTGNPCFKANAKPLITRICHSSGTINNFSSNSYTFTGKGNPCVYVYDNATEQLIFACRGGDQNRTDNFALYVNSKGLLSLKYTGS